ncbi:glyoxalase/bleomycin resistance protein/dioxygenase [Hyphomonas polymorpha PS728]|uniref:Glyoxalase/bleomycin resistance protein/dioxygenase n=1 Tax=Hyphomonas polymorpha PS728 TaxID=1280954 RepID=A0A062VQ73_9PROT|nr:MULTISPECIES: VOC family protein [Hyphomonas]AXE63236.1 lactoylglutathione lyase [Hyphomonas sp. CACIAM 19H1]KDA00454.1 glyoxalase/bleomycin resistance protein/dioxygenase [Hyphomonas polymorpha PS728]
MFDHIGLKVRDIGASVRFYSAALAPLGVEICAQDASSAGLGPPGKPCLWLSAGPGQSAAHIALKSASRDAVSAFYKAGLDAGGRDNGAPGLRPDYGSGYFAAFLIDPDGNNVEAVCMGEGR